MISDKNRLTQQTFAAKFHIPKRTRENLDDVKKECPGYVAYLLELAVGIQEEVSEDEKKSSSINKEPA